MTTMVCPSTLEYGHNGYSPKALKRLFGGKRVSCVLPYESMKSMGIPTLFNSSRKRLSLSGAQMKYSLVVDGDVLRLAREGERGTFILKPCLRDFENAVFGPANEHLTMQIAEQVYGILTAANALCFFGNGEAAYITRRYDVRDDGGRIQQEDMASLAGVTATTDGEDFKYTALSYEGIAALIRQYVASWRIDMVRYFDLMMFNFLFSNGDAHLKNFSLLRRPSGDYGLAPAYDLINTSLHIPDDSAFALSKGLFNGVNQHRELNITTGHTFLVFGQCIGLPKRIAEREWTRFCQEKPLIEKLIEHSFLSDSLKTQYLKCYRSRLRLLRFILGE